MNLGTIIKNYRTQEHLTMEEFSKKSGISKGYISMLENNCNPTSKKPPIPSLEMIKNVAMAIDMDFDSLIKLLDGKQIIDLKEDVSGYLNNIDVTSAIEFAPDQQVSEDNKYKEITDILDTLNNDGVKKVKHYAEDLTNNVLYSSKMTTYEDLYNAGQMIANGGKVEISKEDLDYLINKAQSMKDANE